MKSSQLALKPLPVVIAGILLASPVEAGFLDMLRGSEQKQSEVQRVAFIGSATVLDIVGRVEILKGIEQWEKLESGTELRPGDVIRTADQSRALLRMRASESLVRLTPNTFLRLIPSGEDHERLVAGEETERFIVRSLRGRAIALREGGSWAPVHVNSGLKEGTLVRPVGESSIDVLDRRTGKFVRVHKNAELRLDEGMNMAQISRKPISVAARGPGAR